MNYTYDGDGNRLDKCTLSGGHCSGVTKYYWYGAGTEILDEMTGDGTFSNEYVFFGGKRVARRDVLGGNIYYYAEDMLGSSRTMVQAGQTSPCYDADFYPFGGERVITNTCSQNYKFEGKERDTESGNDDFGARYYSDRIGRWLSADWSSVPVPVPYANLTNPQTLNLYAMVSDNPETFADLDGHGCGPVLPGTFTNCESEYKNDGPSTVGEGFPAPNTGTGTGQSTTQQAQNQVTILGNSVAINYASGLSDADQLAASNAISAAAATINGAQSTLTQSQITDIKAVKGISVVPTEPYSKGNALGVAVTNKGTQAAVAHDLHIRAKIGTYVLNASNISRVSTGYLASTFVHEGSTSLTAQVNRQPPSAERSPHSSECLLHFTSR